MPFPDYDDEIEAAYEAQEAAMPNKPEPSTNLIKLLRGDKK